MAITDKIKTAADLETLVKAKLLVYGPSGAGKTQFAASMPKPLIGLTEKQGILTIKRVAQPGYGIFMISTYQDVIDFVALASSPRIPFDSVILDSLTDVQRIIRDHFTSQQTKRTDVTDQDTWGVVIDRTASIMRSIRDAHAHVVVIALDAEELVNGVGLVHRPAVSGKKLPSQLAQFVQAVGYLHVAEVPGGALRRELSFFAGERYLTKMCAGLEAKEPPIPEWIITRMLGEEPSAELVARIEAWRDLAKQPGA